MLEVLRSGQLSLGPVLERFERDFAAWLGTWTTPSRVSSGTAALHLGVRALGWGAGDEVVTTPFSFVSSANCLLYEDVAPVFCDIDPLTLNIDPEAARAAVTERTAGLLPVHIFGYPAAMADLETPRRRARARDPRGRRGGDRAPSTTTGSGSVRAGTSRSSRSTRTSSW